ncbi:MAG: D-alanyl-D-alanine carboxypeptidase/D-alanyl-D-alanine endopeptidase [Flavisolibacter sp.]
MKTFVFLLTLFIVSEVSAQTVNTKLTQAFRHFEQDAQMKSGIASLYVVDARSGQVVFHKNENVGLAPASTQKIITSAAAYELLGSSFQYKTEFGYTGKLANGILDGDIVVKPSGDPTLGSWRWQQTKEEAVLSRIADAITAAGIREFNNLAVQKDNWEGETIPSGWIWEDIANYYGAGAEALNWRENQFDLVLQSGNVGDDVHIKGTKPALYDYPIISRAKTAAKGTGDNAYIYFPVGRSQAVVRGTIPAGGNNFTISGSMPSGEVQFLHTLYDLLKSRGVSMKGAFTATAKVNITTLHTEVSPPLDSISYWFLKRSINLYGEALAKTIADQTGKEATTNNGVKIIKDLWKEKTPVDVSAFNMYDGSGLSPLNRVTTKGQVAVLRYAKGQPWFGSYFNGFPEYNNMKMKSGTINGAKSFCGYHKAANGKEYVFSFIVNNYNGSASSLVQKMYRVLNVLK